MAVPRAEYLAAQAHAEECRRRFAADIEGVDLLMVPGALGEAPKVSSTGHNQFIGMWTPLHGPDVSLPVGTGPTGLPLGVQLVGSARRRCSASAARTPHRGNFGGLHVIVNGVSLFDEETGEGGAIALARSCRHGLGGST